MSSSLVPVARGCAQQEGCSGLVTPGTHRLALPSQGAEEMDDNEINKSGTTSSAACLCAQILAAGFCAWFPVPVERLTWCGEERAISVSSCY